MKRISGKLPERPGIAWRSERGESLLILRDLKSAFERVTVFRRKRFRSLRGGLNAFGRPKSNSNSLNLSRPPKEKPGKKFFSSIPSHLMRSVLFVRISDQRHPATWRITFPIRSPILSSRSLNTISINGLSSQKLVLPSPHLCFLPANLPNSYNPVG
jgi:hypothetical protein